MSAQLQTAVRMTCVDVVMMFNTRWVQQRKMVTRRPTAYATTIASSSPQANELRHAGGAAAMPQNLRCHVMMLMRQIGSAQQKRAAKTSSGQGTRDGVNGAKRDETRNDKMSAQTARSARW